MRSTRYTVAVGLLLCAVNALCSDGVENPKCGSSWKEECFLPDYHLNNSDPVSLNSTGGKKLIIFLKASLNYTDCKWGRVKGPLMDINETVSVVIPQLSMKDSGLYTLSCKSLEGTNFSKTVALYVAERPSKPQLLLEHMDAFRKSPWFKCLSEGSPRPELELSGSSSDIKEKYPDVWRAESSDTSSHYFDREVMCCATNEEGKECTQLYDFNLSTDSRKPNNVTISPGEPLLLRCRKYHEASAEWQHNEKPLNDSCSKICIKRDQHRGNKMLYAFIRSATLNHSGSYTCKDSKGKAKTMFVDVTDQSFLSSQLPDHFVINDSSSCLTAVVSYHPALQLCYWEAPDGSFTKCIRDPGVTKTRTVKYCGSFQSGAYKLRLEAGEKIETKNTNVCVVERPIPIFTKNGSGIYIETVSVLPANSTWKSLVSPNNSSEIISSWEGIQTDYHPDSDGFCNQKLRSHLSQHQAVDLMFCLTDQAGSWCKEYKSFEMPIPERTKRDAPSNSNLMLLRVGIMALLVALTVVSALLMYYIKKKKPQYQPQLQMIQMVGPNDNDYIYINFKDFDYDKKWEFPRENLELGKELGSGAFGMVVQATAYGINEPGVSQEVAVKMLKEKHQSVEKAALMSELKMLTHIGQHDNIVNLLGACTETGPIYLIFQYCCYGDLLNYLKKSGDRYHKSVTDAFSKDRFSSLYNNLQPKKHSNERITATDHYLPMHGSTTRGEEDIALIPFSSIDMEDPDMYKSEDDLMEQQALTFNDLLNFAYQVAKGMEFLSAKNCIHRDLAARNVLVTKGRMVKIGDFGLARDIDNDSNYVVRGNVRLPVKWMAPESIFQGMYTMKSDVWAYGILLWEIFSLGVTPYPGIKVDHMFYSMIERGFKMECPYYANDSVYDIMCNCWALDPNNRPSFSKLIDLMRDQLMDMEEMLYQNMHDQDVSDYKNASTIGDISALVKETGSKTAETNNYSKANLREETKTEKEEEEPLKPSDGE